jgi:hypothetical protein
VRDPGSGQGGSSEQQQRDDPLCSSRRQAMSSRCVWLLPSCDHHVAALDGSRAASVADWPAGWHQAWDVAAPAGAVDRLRRWPQQPQVPPCCGQREPEQEGQGQRH